MSYVEVASFLAKTRGERFFEYFAAWYFNKADAFIY
jgi:hypothetical protein